MSGHNFKSVKKFIYDQVESLQYDDIVPPFDGVKILQKIKSLMSVSSPYWKMGSDKDVGSGAVERENFFYVEPSNLRNREGKMKLGFRYSEGDAEIAVLFYTQHGGAGMYHSYGEDKIDFKNAWLNHENLANDLFKVIDKSLRFTNREKLSQKFEEV